MIMMEGVAMTELKDALDVLNNIIEQTNDYNKHRMEEYGLTEEFSLFVGTMSDEEIGELTLGQINSYFAQYGIDSGNILQAFSKGDSTVLTIDKWREFFSELKKAVNDLNEAISTRAELKQACDEVYAAEIEFLQSSEYKAAYAEKLDKIRCLAEKEKDPAVKNAYLKKLTALQNSSDLSFLLTRLDDPKINKKDPNKELNRLVDIFFDRNRSQYLMQRYETNAIKMGLNPRFHVNLYDIEEKFLPEYFHPLNNFFLFTVMSYIAYINPEDEIDQLYTNTVLSMMGNLLMEELNDSDKDVLLGIVRNIENRILVNDRMTEKFRQNNTTWKEHPIRKELDVKKAEMKYRLELIDEIKDMLDGYGINLTDENYITAKNASTVLREMETAQIERIRDDVKMEHDRRNAMAAEKDNEDSTENESGNLVSDANI